MFALAAGDDSSSITESAVEHNDYDAFGALRHRRTACTRSVVGDGGIVGTWKCNPKAVDSD